MSRLAKYNPFTNSLDLVDESQSITYEYDYSVILDKRGNPSFIKLSSGIFFYANPNEIPNYDLVNRRFLTREDNTLIDSISANDGDKILPVSTVMATSIAEFTDLTGVTIVSYSGDQLLSISGNNIISSGTGFVFDLLLSDGTFIPFLHLKTDVSGNENHILNITDIGKEYRLVGSSYLQDKGALIYNPYVYGIEWNSATPDTSFDRVGGYYKHQELPIQSKIKRCLVTDDGMVTYLLGGERLDGSQGQVMVEIPEFWYNHEVEGTIHRYLFCEHVQSGWYYHKKSYISAFEATVQRSTGKLSSVINLDTDYRGGNNNSAWDLEVNSLLGKPATSHTRSEFRGFATNRGTGWYQYGAYDHYLVAMLAVCEFANWNLQLAFNPTLDADGFKQGGLGVGPTNANSTEWSNFSGYNPVIPCGSTFSIGNESGEVDVTVTDFGGDGIDRTFKSNSYRGIENPFGHVWEFLDGLNVNEHIAYLSDNYTDFADNTDVNYSEAGLMPAVNGWQKNVMNHILPLPFEIGGGSTTYIGDYYYQSTGWCVARVGGVLSVGSYAGLFCLSVSASSSSRYANVGARLCYSPQI